MIVVIMKGRQTVEIYENSLWHVRTFVMEYNNNKIKINSFHSKFFTQ